MPEPWNALIATLTEPAAPQCVNWPETQRRIVRCLGGIDENGAELAPLDETGPRMDVDTVVLAALSRGPMTLEQLGRATGRGGKALANQIARLRREGRVQRVDVGLWVACA
jgi:hypothetical protein